jgi:hypothetical protein
MERSYLKSIMETVFKQAYQLGKQDMLEGLHISSDVLFKQFIETNVMGFEPQLPLDKILISENDCVEFNSNIETENYK